MNEAMMPTSTIINNKALYCCKMALRVTNNINSQESITTCVRQLPHYIINQLVPERVQEKRTEVLENKVDRM